MSTKTRHANCALSDEDVRQILELRGIKTQKAIAEEFKVNASVISDIHTGKSYRHVPRPDGLPDTRKTADDKPLSREEYVQIERGNRITKLLPKLDLRLC